MDASRGVGKLGTTNKIDFSGLVELLLGALSYSGICKNGFSELQKIGL
jgi:hypothetical protein